MKNLTNIPHFLRTALLATVAAALAATPVEAGWDSPVRLDDSVAYVAPVAAQDGKGRIVVLWRHISDGSQPLVTSIKEPGGQFSAFEVVADAYDVGGFDLAGNRKGHFAAVWSAFDGFSDRIFEADLLPKATEFGFKTPISDASEDKKYPKVALDKKGGTYVAWVEKTGPGLEAAVRPAKGTWEPSLPISLTHEASGVSIGASDKGAAVLTWSRWNGMTNETHASVRQPNGAFEPADQVSTPDQNAFNPYLTVHPRGGASVFYETSVANLQPGAALFDAPVADEQRISAIFRYDKKGNLYAFWTRFGPAFKAVLAVRPAGSDTFGDEVEFGDGIDDAYAGDVAIDSKGNVRVVWVQYVNGSGNIVRTAYRPKDGVFSDPEDLTDFDASSVKRVFLDKKGLATVLWQDTLNALWATSQSE